MDMTLDEKDTQTIVNSLRASKQSLKRQLDKNPESVIIWSQFKDVSSALAKFEAIGY